MIRPILLLSLLSQAPTTRDWLWTGRLALGNLWALLDVSVRVRVLRFFPIHTVCLCAAAPRVMNSGEVVGLAFRGSLKELNCVRRLGPVAYLPAFPATDVGLAVLDSQGNPCLMAEIPASI